MYLILRPWTPPWALTYLKYAFALAPTTPNDEALPLSGTVPPITICFDVTPGVPLETPLAGTDSASAARATRPKRFTGRPVYGERTGTAARGPARPSPWRASVGRGRAGCSGPAPSSSRRASASA